MHKFNLNFRQTASARAGDRANVAFGHWKRMVPYLKKPIIFFTKFKDKIYPSPRKSGVTGITLSKLFRQSREQ